ncbi:hypothetical protein PINS_up001732 [Pythium insidiosum]|nr:hypothetical protein PINS_up001732 [Pythium insidiosum]
MASKYAKPLQIPSEFPDVLRNFAREVLRLQGKVETKEQIYEFGAHYFQELLVKRDGAGAKLAPSSGAGGSMPAYMSMTEEELRDALVAAFHEVDGGDSGVVTFEGLQQVRPTQSLTLSMFNTQ